MRRLQTLRPAWGVFIVITLLGVSTLACSVFSSPASLNDGQGTRNNPVTQGVYAKTLDFDVRALGVMRKGQNAEDKAADSESDMLRIRLQIRCTKPSDDVCVLETIGRSIKLVDTNGVLYDPVYGLDIENPLEGEILGDAEKAGWLVYELPRGIEVFALAAEYGDEHRVFFALP